MSQQKKIDRAYDQGKKEANEDWILVLKNTKGIGKTLLSRVVETVERMQGKGD